MRIWYNKSDQKEAVMHEGHRKRMRERFLNSRDGLQDHELLEILLYGAIPRKNTNEIAHRLLDAFGSLSGVLKADYAQLMTVEGIGETAAVYLCCIAQCMEQADREENLRLPNATNFEQVSQYFSRRFRDIRQEVIELYTGDCHETLTLAGRYTSNKPDKARVLPESIGKILASKQPYCIILVHTHPFGECLPSRQDDLFTGQVQLLCAMHNVKFYDHLIVSPKGIYSYHRAGKMDEIRKEYSMDAIFGTEAR